MERYTVYWKNSAIGLAEVRTTMKDFPKTGRLQYVEEDELSTYYALNTKRGLHKVRIFTLPTGRKVAEFSNGNIADVGDGQNILGLWEDMDFSIWRHLNKGIVEIQRRSNGWSGKVNGNWTDLSHIIPEHLFPNVEVGVKLKRQERSIT